MRNLFCAFTLTLISNALMAQSQFPFTVKWKEIKTEHFRVIVPEGVIENATEAVFKLEEFYSPVSKPLLVNPKPIPFLFHNQSVISNGFVTLAPRYMCFYATPFQDVSSSLEGSDWITLLASHEYRHVAQFARLESGFTDVAGDIFGDYGKMVCMYLSTPFWFFEGDAIVSETALTKAGRGRTPSFYAGIMANELEGKRFSYDKAYLGSYRDFVPNHYHLGYLLNASVNRNNPPDVWNPVLDRTTRLSFSPFSFSKSLKLYTGLNLKNTYNRAFNEYDSIWKVESAFRTDILTEQSEIVSPGYDYWTDLNFPFGNEQGEYLALKYGLETIPALVLISNNSEKTLIEIAPIDRIHSNGHSVVWAEQFPDIRWGERNYADIVVYNIASGEKTRLTHKGRYFAPALSPDGNRISVIEYTENMNCSLVILNAHSGNEELSLPIPDGCFARMPSWSENEQEIVTTLTKEQEKALAIFDLELKTHRIVGSWTTENVTNPVFYRNYLLFNSTISGFDEIHALDTTNGERFLLVASKYGVMNPHITNSGKLVYQNYTAMGSQINSLDISEALWKPVNTSGLMDANYLYRLAPIEPTDTIQLTKQNETDYQVKNYSPLLNALKIHSWNPRIGYRSVGFNFYSNDILNTTALSLGFDYFPKDFAHREFARIEYNRFYPVFGAEFSYGQQYKYLTDTNDKSDFWKMDEKLFDFSVGIPLDFSYNVYSTSLIPKLGYLYAWQQFDADSFYLANKTEIISALYTSADFTNHKAMAPRDIYPQFGQEATISFLKSIGNGSFQGNQITARVKTYFPGIWLHHSLQLTAGYDRKAGDYLESIYLLDYTTEPVNGFENEPYKSSKRVTLNYALPILTPDAALGPIIYCKRVSVNTFYDWGKYKLYSTVTVNQSVGFDVNFDLNLLRFLAVFQLGVRCSYRLNDQTAAIDILILGVPF